MMTEANTGLRKALARAGGSVVTVSDMKADELIAAMSDEQKADIAAALTPALTTEEPDASDEGGEGDEQPEETPVDDGLESGAELTRVKAVAAAVETDPACKGKAELALQMLADDDYATLSAAGIVKLLGKAAAPVSGASDAEVGERAAMLAALSGSANSNISPNNGSGAKDQAADALWAKAHAKINPNKKAA